MVVIIKIFTNKAYLLIDLNSKSYYFLLSIL